MSDWVPKDAIRAARRVNLYDFLLSRHPNDVTVEGDSLRLACDHSVSIKRGYTGYMDFADYSTGNSVDCLTRYFGYTLQEAAEALCGSAGISIDIPDAGPDAIDLDDLGAPAPSRHPAPLPAMPKPAAPDPPPRVFDPPAPADLPYPALYAYLSGRRGIPGPLVRRLVEQGLLYQDRDHGNAVFVNRHLAFGEIRGTGGSPFHGTAAGSSPQGYWEFRPRGPGSVPKEAIVCEASIDALSFYLLLSLDPTAGADDAAYCAIGGAGKQQAIDAIKAYMDAAGGRTVIAVDNDEAGEKCRLRNPDCWTAMPRLKDWNADWLAARPPPGA